MIDLHSHFLFGIDDGAKDIDTTVEMLKQAEGLGITHLIATPHINDQTDQNKIKQIHSIFSEVKKRIKKENIQVEIKLAAELGYDTELINLSTQSWVFIGERNRYILFELPLFNLPLNIEDTLFQLRLKKIIPVLAHPERNIKIQENYKILLEWIRQDCLVQINAGSIMGQFGKPCQIVTDHLLAFRAIHFVGSDAHDPRHRRYHILIDAYQYVLKKYGKEYANILFYENPEKMWNDESVIPDNFFPYKIYQKISQKLFRKVNLFRLLNR
jgi:protein-tyrosine phosphatase